MSLSFLPPELQVEICRFLNVKDRFVLRGVSREFCDIVDYSWVNDSVIIVQRETLTDEKLKFFRGVKKISLCWCKKITGNGLEVLKGVKEINLCGCNQITDNGLEVLQGVKEIDLSGCNQITDNGLKFLEGAEIIR